MTIDKILPRPGLLLARIEVAEGATKTDSGIILTDQAKQETMRVIAIGPTPKGEDECFAKVDDVILVQEYGGNKLKLGMQEYLFLKFAEVLAVIKQ